MTATSTSEKSCLASLSVHASFCTRCVAWWWSRFIFQLPAMSGVRGCCAMWSALLLENGDAGQLLALEELEARAATGRDVAEAGLVEAELAHGGRGVAPADDRERAP